MNNLSIIPLRLLTTAGTGAILALGHRECQQLCIMSAGQGCGMELSERKKKILAAVVDDYILTAEPVGSKTLAETSCLGCSSATIRNELAELVSLGYLEQPHTSAGRIPTPQGYRMYVNELMKRQKLSIEESEQINKDLNNRMQQLDNLVSDIGSIASQFTDYPAMALAQPMPATISRFDLIYIDANTFIIVAMLSNKTVKNKLVHLPVSVGQNTIQRLSSVFNANFTDITEDKITPIMISSAERAADDTMGLTSVIASFALEILSHSQTGEAYISGATKLLGLPEYRDPNKAHALMA
ncbi:MAG: heat-inducible transcription repressor HrcA, partial [Clostridia bacterium]|nr:heat-inducible transcription repressor HrcA [Clostridia bacterium]